MVRQFAHQVRPDRKPTDRVDFSETVYWSAGVKTDAGTGEATVSFALSDSVTTFRVFADAFAGDGAVGAADLGVEVVQPFYTEAKLPLEVTAGDQILLPINLINATTGKLMHTSVNVDLQGDSWLQQLVKGNEEIGAMDRVRGFSQSMLAPATGYKTSSSQPKPECTKTQSLANSPSNPRVSQLR
jgi:uncharacterized protein YfaS (alpha-2-macroglobulin family)